MATATTTPSTLARSVAGQLWPDVQKQYKLAPGAFAFSCAGHGGIVALVSELDLPEATLQAAREHGLIALAARVNHGRRTRTYCTANGYDAAELRAMKDRYPADVSLAEVWIGEEDCDWATLALVSERVRDGMHTSGYTTGAVTRAAAFECVQRWNERYLVALDAAYVPLPEGQIAAQDRVRALLDAGEFLNRAAWGDWADGVPAGHVRVLFEDKAGNERHYIMPQEVYAARTTFPCGGALNATPAMFAAVGPIQREQ